MTSGAALFGTFYFLTLFLNQVKYENDKLEAYMRRAIEAWKRAYQLDPHTSLFPAEIAPF